MIRKLLSCRVLHRILGLIGAVVLLEPLGWSQQFSRLDRERAQVMLENVAADVRREYYDPELHGIDWDAKVRAAKKEIASTTSIARATSEIAAVLEALNDSHTFFLPPEYTARVDYGWQFQMVGNRPYVTQVRPGSDAESKGMKPGDEVVMIDGFTPTRESLWKMEYALNVLSPQSGLQIGLIDPLSKKFRKINVQADIRQRARIKSPLDQAARLDSEEARQLARPRYEEVGADLMILKIPSFIQSKLEVEGLLDRARMHKTLIVDLRGNGGGIEDVLKYWLGGMFQSDVRMAERVTRGKKELLKVKSNHHHAFSGKLIVLVDSGSASASELFARVVQIEKRGNVLGDRTSGRTMEGEFCVHLTEGSIYGAMVTHADLVMADGKSLEHVGVTPDETVLPLAADLASGRDPAMSRAAGMAGVELSPESAGKMFPREWATDHTFVF
jgi:carboxyl-terminal processing protease